MASVKDIEWYCHVARRYVSARDLRLCHAINKMFNKVTL